MLSLLHIENIAVIERADISFDAGFNVLTGETGAGKSIVIDAISAIMGQRAYRDMIRTGAENGKHLLLIKDSYGNTFAQFPAEDYAEVHVIDLRFFRGDVTEYAKENGITDVLVLYGAQNFVKDTNIVF